MAAIGTLGAFAIIIGYHLIDRRSSQHAQRNQEYIEARESTIKALLAQKNQDKYVVELEEEVEKLKGKLNE